MTPGELKEYYRTLEFQREYFFEGELGAILTDEGTEFRLWSPLSKEVSLRLYRTGEGESLIASYQMEKGKKGVWVYQTTENLHGIYYDFKLESKLGHQTSADPYAKAAGLNGKRSMVVDLKLTNPEDWELDMAPKKEAEDIIYEVHVKEFSYAPEGGFEGKNRGKYLAFTENKEGKGLNYIKSLGVNHIQFLPIFDYASVDEEEEDAFNWGYDPLNYNVPEGSYSTNPGDGAVRIKECKEMIKACHERGLRVIMDVVYNHTYSLNSWFQKTVPWYFYRVDDIGGTSDGSACGNDFATEMKMAGKYILDSVLYWAREYHIDGFRFDLMGLMDVKLMNRIRAALDEEFGKGEKLMYGEPWSADRTFTEGNETLAVKANLGLLSDGIGIFSDDIRDGIKGSVFYEGLKGFANGDSRFTENIVAAITAFTGETAEKIVQNPTAWQGLTTLPSPKSPNQILNYVSCHDNQTLWDKLSKTTEDETLRLKQYRLAASIYLMSQGRCFLYSGEEFLRTKNGEHNTYNAPISLNRIDWDLAVKNKAMVDFYKGLIALRKEFTGLSDKGEKAYQNISFRKVEEGFIRFVVKNEVRGNFRPRFREALILLNAGEKERKVDLAEGKYLLLSDGENSTKWLNEEAKVCSKEVVIPPCTAYILGLE